MSEKFGNNPAAEHLYGISLDGGCDSEINSTQYGGWHGMIRHLWDDDREAMCVGEDISCAILYEDPYGFVFVNLYTTEDEMDAAWAQLEVEEERAVLLSYLDSKGLISPAAWDIPLAQVLHQVREANAFTEEEWTELLDDAWNNAY